MSDEQPVVARVFPGFASTWKESDGTWSWARVASSFTVATAIFCLVFLVVHNHVSPDPLTLGGLATFGGFPYCANKVAAAWGKNST